MNQQEFHIEDEANYVLGMMELYENDKDIEKMLRQKGLSDEQIQRILNIVKTEGYLKRIRQAKRIMLIGYGILLFFLLLGIYIAFNPENFVGMFAEKDPLARGGIRMLRTPFYVGFVYGIAQSIYGTSRFFSYKRKLRLSTHVYTQSKLSKASN